MPKYRYRLDGGPWVEINEALPSTIPSAADEVVEVEAIGATATVSSLALKEFLLTVDGDDLVLDEVYTAEIVDGEVVLTESTETETYDIEALDQNGDVAETVSVTATGPGPVLAADIPNDFTFLEAGETYTFVIVTPESDIYVEPTAVPDQMSAPNLTGGNGEAFLTLGPSPEHDGGSEVLSYEYLIDVAGGDFSSPVAQGTQDAADLGDPITVTPLAAGDYKAIQIATNAQGDSIPSAASADTTVNAAGPAFPTVSGSSGATVTQGVDIGGNTYDLYDFTSGGSITFVNSAEVEALLVGGGGGGGDRDGGGGGAGEFVERLISGSGGIPITAQQYAIVIGAGGARRGVGGSTTALGLTAIGGGGGGTFTGAINGRDGGSGGGASRDGAATGGASIASDGFGNAGGGHNSTENKGGGGGGAGQAGQTGAPSLSGDGGDGLQSDITGTLTYYAGGGAGAGADGGLGGGGGGSTGQAAGVDGLGGGGRGGDASTRIGFVGGSGRVIIRVRTAQ